MTLSEQEVRHIAALARLQLTDEEITRYRGQLSDILDHARRLQQVDTANTKPITSVLSTQDPLREDTIKLGFRTDQALFNAPRTERNQFKVPPVLDTE